MKPGDLIEWYYKYNNDVVFENEMLWSSTMKRLVPIGIISILLHQDDKTYSWKNSKGCFHARVSNLRAQFGLPELRLVFPHERE
jgi:hypothetical protein